MVRRLILENVSTIRILASRISQPNLMIAQTSIPEFNSLLNEPSIKINGRAYGLKEGLIMNSQNESILIPPKLEGTVLSHAHLACEYVRSKYDFKEKLKEKFRNLATLCHVCYVSNPSTHRKSTLHSIVASYLSPQTNEEEEDFGVITFSTRSGRAKVLRVPATTPTPLPPTTAPPTGPKNTRPRYDQPAPPQRVVSHIYDYPKFVAAPSTTPRDVLLWGRSHLFGLGGI